MPWWRRRSLILAGVAAALVVPAARVSDANRFWRPSPAPVQAAARETTSQVWLVDRTAAVEIYSNGLRIERAHEVSNEPRRYTFFARGEEDSRAARESVEPAGIVFHTTESPQEEFSEGKTKRLRYLGLALLQYVVRERAYHYLIDRFGQVWRVVRETDAAWHAGNSVWADRRNSYVNLNHSFLGVSVEAETAGQVTGRMRATPAQMRALQILTEMLRTKYGIAAANCVTHAQVSVNPGNMQVGYHTDWAAHFPYEAIGLPDNYAVPSPALPLFGFSYDPSLVQVTGERYWKGLLLGEEQLRQDATAHGQTLPVYRQRLAERYRTVLNSVKEQSAQAKEKEG